MARTILPVSRLPWLLPRPAMLALLPWFASGPITAGSPDGHAVIRAPAGGSEIVITTTPRLAGAIHSLTWGGKEFIDSADHGRQLQSASNLDAGIQPIAAETYNPTEAGSVADGAGPTSSSQLLDLASGPAFLQSTTRMAFWLPPGGSSGGQAARNRSVLSDHLLTKRLTIGHPGLPQAIPYQVTFTLPPGERHTEAVFEALTGYMPMEFSEFFHYVPSTGRLAPLSVGPGEQADPVVLAVPGGTHAMGIYAPPQPSPDTIGPSYGRFRFDDAKVVKWNCVFRRRSPSGVPPGEYTFKMFVLVGDLEMVRAGLERLHHETKAAAPAAPMGDAPVVPPQEKILATLRAGHPRVMADATTFAAIKDLVGRGGLPENIYREVRKSADKILAAPVSGYEIPDGKRLLHISRRVLDRVRTLALVYRLENDVRYADRAWQELSAAARFPDWNPPHFLDTAEMTHAFALGYDWLFDRWTDGQRQLLQEAIVTKGLRPGLAVYESGKGWPKNENNWNQVCNGGLLSGALAIADVEPDLAGRIVREAVLSVPLAMRHFAPDGAGTEGATYWSYAARYNIVLLSALETALGTDFGLKHVGAFGASGYYQIYLGGANRVAFDFADCSRVPLGDPQHFWLARAYDVPAFSRFRLDALANHPEGGGVLDLLWFDDRGSKLDFSTLPLDRHFRGAECASLRGSWAPDALMVGIQAGDSMNLGGHRHLDLGSFVLDARGERWIIDSGTEKETYQTHRNKNKRHAYYRVRAEGHNVPVLNPGQGPDQNPKAVAKITRFESTPGQAVAVVDLGQAYQPHATRAIRTFTLAERKRLIVTDELDVRQPADLWWFLHTEAQVKLADQDRTAILSQNGKTFTVRLQSPAGASFTLMDCQPLASSPNPQPQNDNRDRRKLALHLPGTQATRIQVSLEP